MTAAEVTAGLGAAVAAYLLGSVTAGWYLVRWRTGGDLRQLGSGSLGGRNTARAVGLRWASIAAAWDLLKGALAAALALVIAPGWIAAAMVAVVAGHVWPVQLGFHGGRGIAPAFGALLAVSASVALAVAATFGVLTLLARSTLVPVILAAVTAVLWAGWLGPSNATTLGTAGIAAIVVLGHAAPVRALVARHRQP